MKFNLGCGNDYKEEYHNCDYSRLVKIDEYVDLEEDLRWRDDIASEILVYHVLEHINNFIPLVHELYRISRKDGIIKIKTPFYSSWGQFNDPTHVRFFTPFTFNYFNLGNYSHEAGSNKKMFEIKVKINYGIGVSSCLNWLMNPIINLNHLVYCRLFAWIIPSSEIEYELKVLK